MSPIALLLAIAVALSGLGLVVLDMQRRQSPKQTQLLWGGGVAGGIGAGFLAPALHDGLYDAVFRLLYGTPDHVVHPLEQDMPILLVGFLTTIVGVVVYAVGSRIP